jgi:hypothetical protein
MKKRTNFMIGFTIIILFLFSTSIVYSANLQGKLNRFGPHGILPASFVPVTLHTIPDKKILRTVNSGSDGMYYFNHIVPGDYILRIWVKNFRNESLNYTVRVLEQEYTNIKPIVIHFLEFEIPKKGSRLIEGTVIKPRGSHYALPDDAFLWIVLSDSLNNYFLRDLPVFVDKDGSWTSNTVSIGRNITGIHAVMLTREGNKIFQKKVEKKEWQGFKDLPGGSYIIASQDIKVHTR